MSDEAAANAISVAVVRRATGTVETATDAKKKNGQACVDAGDLPKGLNTSVAMRALMVGIVGVAVLRLSDRLGPGEDADLLATDVLNLTLAGLRSDVALQSSGLIDCPIEIEPVADAQAS